MKYEIRRLHGAGGTEAYSRHMIESFNKTVDYIESVSGSEIDEKKIAVLSGYSYSMFRRIFSILTGMTLSEYMRFRKLTRAAEVLRETDKKIIDIALDAGYDSPDSFGLAFKNFHGYTPTEVRNGKPFRVLSRIKLALSIKGGNTMNITIQKKAAFTVAGINFNDIESSLCPKVWKDLYAKHTHEELAKLGSGRSFGMCHGVEDFKKINYMACYDAADVKAAKAMGLETASIAEAEYAVVDLCGKVPECIHKGWKYLFEVFFPEHGYRHSGAPDFEVYEEGDMTSDAYRMQLWVPIEKE